MARIQSVMAAANGCYTTAVACMESVYSMLTLRFKRAGSRTTTCLNQDIREEAAFLKACRFSASQSLRLGCSMHNPGIQHQIVFWHVQGKMSFQGIDACMQQVFDAPSVMCVSCKSCVHSKCKIVVPSCSAQVSLAWCSQVEILHGVTFDAY